MKRDYILHLPRNYDPSNNIAVPILLDYHGYTANALIQIALLPWSKVADMDETGTKMLNEILTCYLSKRFSFGRIYIC